ncbi:MAG: DoxX family protein [Deltaproteobacteria bacterium]|nr:DoxX family protein [Deltaproteobacteria bacterium]
MNAKALAVQANTLLERCGVMLQPVILLIFRVHWGWAFYVTGKGKLLSHSDIVEFFTNLGIPFPGFNAWFVGGLECFGGLLLLIGLCSRPIAFVLAINMLVAYLSVPYDRAKLLTIFQDADPFLNADPFFFLLTAVLVFAFGPGLFSLDALVAKTLRRPKKELHFN